ncbi:MAG: cyclodeaminase/cyclohydrolase family protein, partial [Candidatus Omnitrophica bacterium]|nr:cyclodeaminase/cyclohydrolase family protein [Candidatus Omnitrophota bacterium]
MYADSSLKIYLDDLAAKKSAPGGGSAAALNAALGAALISMVANFTIGKSKYAKYEKEVKDILEKSEKLRTEFLGLVDLDVRAYESKDPRKAMEIPFMLCRLCFEAVKLCPPL